MYTENQIGDIIIDCAFKVHSQLGPGLLESTYQACLHHELVIAGLAVLKQHPLPVIYDTVHLQVGYRLDLYVEKKVICEIKSVDALNQVHLAQILTYLKLSESKLGYLINFNTKLLKHGIRRVVNNL